MDIRRWWNGQHSERQDVAYELVAGSHVQSATTQLNHGDDKADRRNLVMLFGLYLIHSIPMAFAWGTMPVLLRHQASYLAVGSFVLVQYPYSLKVFWSPIVESFHWPWLGPRKSWLVPSYLCNALLLWWLARHQDVLIRQIASGSTSAMGWLLTAWFGVSLSCANIRIALDAWSLELISPASTQWFGSVVTVSENIAYFVAFNTFLGLSFLQSDGDYASVRGFFVFISLTCIITAALVLLKSEEKTASRPSTMRHGYRIILSIVRLPQVWTIFAVHMISLLGFITADTVTVLQLVKNGFSDSDIALLATISVPTAAIVGFWVSRWFRKWHPLEMWRFVFPIRLANAVLAQMEVMLIYHFRGHAWRWYIAVIPDILTASLEAAMLVCIITYHAQVSDPRHGAIYLPMLTTTLDLRYAVLQFASTKAIGILDGAEDVQQATRLVDGYQIVNAGCVAIAVPLFWYYLRPATVWLQSQSADKWRVDVSPSDHEL